MRSRTSNTAAILVWALAVGASAQTVPVWNQVAGDTVNLGLAGPATGPIQAAAYFSGGAKLQIRTESGRVFETGDFQHWSLNTSNAVLTPSAKPVSAVRPESGTLIATSGARRYSLTSDNVYGSDDGRFWVNLTGFNGRSIIGDGFSALAVSPSNPLDIAAANQTGVWRSLDGGLSWQSLNENLPNLNARRLAGQRTIVLTRGNDILASVTAGKWTAVDGVDQDSVLRENLASKYGIIATAAEQSGAMVYAGTADGRVFIIPNDNSAAVSSRLGSAISGSTTGPTTGAITRIWIDPANPQAALAAADQRLYRTTNAGKFWDDVTGTLSAGTIHGITADSSASVVYLATDSGIFSGQLALNAADQTPASWKQVTGNLPIAAAWDARLNIDGTLTVVLDGYGVWETPAPHRAQTRRIVNGADMSSRAAAPGSLITVIGVNVKQAASGQNPYSVLLATDQNSQLQVPFEVTPGMLQLVVQIDGGEVWMAPLNVKQAAPAIFVDTDGTPMVQNAASGLVVDSGTPLRGGTVIQVLATGLGRVTPEWPTGKPAPVDSPPVVAAAVTAFLDGTPIRVTRAILAPTLIGSYLVELEIPAIVNRGANELRIVVNGEESNRVKLFLEPGLTGQ